MTSHPIPMHVPFTAVADFSFKKEQVNSLIFVEITRGVKVRKYYQGPD